MSGWRDTFLEAWHAAAHRLLRLLPVDWASAIGGYIVRWNVRFNRPEIVAGARDNLRRHRPDLSDSEIDASIHRFADNVGRFMAEFSVLERIGAQGRISIRGHEHALRLDGKAPVLAILLHTGNWEVFGPALRSVGIQTNSIYEPPASAVERRIVEDMRRKLGFNLLGPNHKGLRDALAVLARNKVVTISGDETRNGVVMAPLFGRPPHRHGNLALAAKMARRSGAHIMTAHAQRLQGCRFALHISEPFRLPETGDLLDDVAFLNARIEPIILSLLDQWYHLDDQVTPVDSRPRMDRRR